MTDINSFTSATPLVVIAVAVICSLLKPLLEASALPPTSKTHDTIIRLLSIALGVLVVLVANLLVPRAGGITGAVIFSAVVEGGKAGIISVATYHLLTGSIFDGTGTQTASLTVETHPADPPPAPAFPVEEIVARLAPLLAAFVAPPRDPDPSPPIQDAPPAPSYGVSNIALPDNLPPQPPQTPLSNGSAGDTAAEPVATVGG